MKKLPRKRRTREHVIADLSVNYVERHALVCGFVVERVAHDYGIDLELFTFNRNGEIDEGKVLLQVKASDQLRGSRGQQMFPFRIDRRDLVLWLALASPADARDFDRLRCAEGRGVLALRPKLLQPAEGL